MTYTEPLNPAQIEALLQQTVDRIATNVRVVSDAQAKAQEVRRAYDRAYARAFLTAPGPAYTKKYRAELATIVEREAAEVAEQAYDHARRLSRAMEKELDAIRSVGASVRSMYESTRV